MSILKWLGGKTQLLPQIMNIIPTHIRNYVEPFVGGGSVLLEVCSRIKSGTIRLTGTITASDKNPILIHFYLCVQQSPNELFEEVQRLHKLYIEYTEDEKETYYYSIRERFNKEPLGTIKKSAMFLFLNKTCFRGVYREGPHGFNVPFGNYMQVNIIDKDYLLSVSSLIQNVIFVCRDFTELFTQKWSKQDFIYFDPPYVPEDVHSFTNYTVDGFKQEQHLLLFDWCKNLKSAGIPFLLSNSNTNMVREHFPSREFSIVEVSAKRSIHSKRPQTRTTELFIC